MCVGGLGSSPADKVICYQRGNVIVVQNLSGSSWANYCIGAVYLLLPLLLLHGTRSARFEAWCCAVAVLLVAV